MTISKSIQPRQKSTEEWGPSLIASKTGKDFRDELSQFLVDLVSIPSESCFEKDVVQRIKNEMEKVGFDSVKIDGLGNIIGRIGHGKRVIAMDAHIDTVGPGKREDWKTEPLKGTIIGDHVYGVGAVDQKAGMASMVYGVKLIRELDLLSDYTLYVVGTVQEEDCDGMCWRYIIEQGEIRPECVVITEPTNLNIYIGHRGRMEMKVATQGKSAHGSMPHLGDNAIYSMGRVVGEIESLNERLKADPFLGKGSITVSHITSQAPSLCSVPYKCTIHIDRRLTLGENRETAVGEIEEIIKSTGVNAEVFIPRYEKPSYKNTIHPTDCYFPTWKLPEDHPLLSTAEKTYRALFLAEPQMGKWTFSTNGVATMGVYGIPTLGFGPGDERLAHSPNECVPIEHLIKASAWYALFPAIYAETMEDQQK